MPPKAAPKPAAKKPAAKTAAAPEAKKKAETKPAAAAAPAKAAPAAAKAAPAAAKKTAATGSGNGVYVKGLGDTSADAIKEVFSASGKVSSVQVRRNKYALVFFDSNASATKAISALNNKEFKGQALTVVAAKTAAKADATAGTKVVFASPIFRANTTRNQARELFAGFGKIQKLKLYQNNAAFIYFDSASAAQKAVADKNGTTYKDKKLLVKLSVRSLEKDKAHAAAHDARHAVKKAMKTH